MRLQERIQGANPCVIILSGGPNSVHVEGSPKVPAGFFEYCSAQSIPVLGICYGMQVCCRQPPPMRPCETICLL